MRTRVAVLLALAVLAACSHGPKDPVAALLADLEGLLPPSAAYRFELDAAEEGGTWRVRGAAWVPVEIP